MKHERIEELCKYAQVVVDRVPGGEAVIAGHELLHLLRCARAVAELESWLRGADDRMLLEVSHDRKDDGYTIVAMKCMLKLVERNTDLLTAIEAALARAKETK